MTKCRITSCTDEAYKDQLCEKHYQFQLRRIEAETHTLSAHLSSDVKQFLKLRAKFPDLSIKELAHRIVTTPKAIRALLKFFGGK